VNNKNWFDMTDKEKIERLSSVVFILHKRLSKVEEFTNSDAMPGYEVLRMTTTPEADDKWLGAYNGVFAKSKSEEAA
jgi:hypothetical protein